MSQFNAVSGVTYVELDFICLLIILALTLIDAIQQKRFGRRTFILVWVVSVLYCVYLLADMLWALSSSYGWQTPFTFFLFNDIFFISLVTAAACWLIHTLRMTHEKWKNVGAVNFVLLIPALYICFFVVSSFSNGMMFYYTLPDYGYERGSLFFVYQCIENGYLVASSVISLICLLKTKDRQKKRLFLTLTLYAFPIYIFSLLQILTGLNFLSIGYVISSVIWFGSSFYTNSDSGAREKERVKSISRFLMEHYYLVFMLDLKTGKSKVEFAEGLSEDIRNAGFSENPAEVWNEYAEIYVHPDDREFFKNILDTSNIKSLLATHKSYHRFFRTKIDGDYQYVDICLMKAEEAGEGPENVMISLENVDRRYRAELKMQRTMNLSQSVIESLSEEYDYVATVDLDSGNLETYYMGKDFSLGINLNNDIGYDTRVQEFTEGMYPDDIPDFRKETSKENILDWLQRKNVYSVYYRMMQNGEPRWFESKYFRNTSDPSGNSVICGVQNIHKAMLERLESENREKEIELQQIVNWLAEDFSLICNVDIQTGREHVIRVSKELNDEVPQDFATGFFRDRMRHLLDTFVYEEDKEAFEAQAKLPSVLEGLEQTGTFFVNYRVFVHGEINHWQVKYTFANDEKSSILAGFHNVDAEFDAQEQQTVVTNKLAKDFEFVAYIRLGDNSKTDVMKQYRASSTLRRNIPNWEAEQNAARKFVLLKEHIVAGADKEDFVNKTSREVTMKHLEKENAYFVNFKAVLDGIEKFCQIKFMADRESNGAIKGAVVGLHNVDEETRNELQKREEIEKTVRERTMELNEKNVELNRFSEGVIDLMGDIVEGRDEDSGQHIRRVKGFTCLLATQVKKDLKEYGLTDQNVNLITNMSAMHDVGKIAIPDAILLKPGKLTPEEFETMKKHCVLGCRLVKRMEPFWRQEYLDMADDICRYHHEKWDGRGYPYGLKGDEIPIAAQIVSIADIYDALTTERVYKPAYSEAKAFQMIMNGECGMFSEKLLSCFEKCREGFEAHAKNPERMVFEHL